MKMKHTAPDWPTMITELEGAGHSTKQICAAMGFGPSDSIIRHYKRGVQPIYHRGEPLIDLWCKVMGKTRDDVPRASVRVPYQVPYSVRVAQKAAASVVVPDFPVAPPVKKAGRKARAEA